MHLLATGLKPQVTGTQAAASEGGMAAPPELTKDPRGALVCTWYPAWVGLDTGHGGKGSRWPSRSFPEPSPQPNSTGPCGYRTWGWAGRDTAGDSGKVRDTEAPPSSQPSPHLCSTSPRQGHGRVLAQLCHEALTTTSRPQQSHQCPKHRCRDHSLESGAPWSRPSPKPLALAASSIQKAN